MEINHDLYKKLKVLAYESSQAFCYHCYRNVSKNDKGEYCCPTCFSDDLMRSLDGVGCEYGSDWVIEHLIQEHCEPVDTDEMYEQFLDEIYPDPVKICGTEFDAVWAFKKLDPIAYNLGKSEWLNSEVDEEILIEVGDSYYSTSDIEAIC